MHKRVIPTLAVVIVAILSACGGGDDTVSSPTPVTTTTPSPTPPAAATASPSASDTPTPDASPTASPTPATTVSSPYALADLEREWEDRDITVTLGGSSTGLGGFGGTATDVRLTKGGDTMDLSVLVYGGSEAAGEDWEFVPGEAPTAKLGHNLPEHVSTWWNENIVVVVRSTTGEIGTDALAGFLDLGS